MRLLWVFLAAVLVVGSSASVTSKTHKKATSEAEKKHLAEIEKKLEDIKELEAELEREIEAAVEEEEESSDEENEMIEEQENEGEEEVAEEEVAEEELVEDDEAQDSTQERDEFFGDPCLEVYCGAGRMCVIDDDGKAQCVCVNSCESEEDTRRRVCSNFNETWMSDCELYRQRCLCQEDDESCSNVQNKHAHIEYYGECQEMSECVDEELEDFPRRMSEWLFNIMRDMADQQTLSEHYIRLEREAEEDPKKQWSYAVVWKWCDLDSHPRDKAVSRHELFPIKAPLLTLENCIATFLDICDANSDHAITLREWATCTRMDEEELEKFESFCEDIRDE